MHIFILTLFVMSAGALTGCGESPTVDFYSVLDLYPKVIEPGDVLIVEGEGFIEGKAQILLEGTAKPMGLQPAEPFRHTLTGTATSETRIEVPITAYLMDRMAKQAIRFSGNATVSFPDIQLDSAISLSGQSPVQRLEFRPTGGGIKIHAMKIREARRAMKTVGLLLESETTDDAITVTGVVQHSLADQSGISKSARLISVDGFPLMGLDELAGLAMDTPHQFEFILPDGTSRQIYINPKRSIIDTDAFAAILLTSLFLGIFLAFILPPWGARRLNRSPALENPLPFVMGYAAAALLTVLFPAVVIQWQLQLNGTLVLIAVFLICNAILLIYGNQTLSVRISNAVGSLFGVGAVVLMGGISGNTLGLFNVSMAQSQTLFGYHVWKNPVMMLATVLAISLLWPARFTRQSTSLQFVAAWLHTIAGTMLLVFFCLGGWTIPGLPDIAPTQHIGMMLAALFFFFAKTWIVLLAARHLAGATTAERRRFTAVSGLYQLRWMPLPVLAGCAVYLDLSPIPAEMQMAGQIISTGVFCTLFSLVVFSRILGRPKERQLVI
ncbi:MAG: hypothetical protein JXX14_14250 [Deltaproteobacteria bacterium]|nr:hypothetical protein [Deltaproteobacteria bacterium]